MPPKDPRISLRRDLIAAGYDDKAITRLLRSGVLTRIRHGAYADAPEWSTLSRTDQHLLRTRAVLEQAKSDLLISHASALVAHGAPTWRVNLDKVHVTRTDKRAGRRESGVVQHRGLILPADRCEVEEWPVTSPTRTCLDATMFLPIEPALCVVNDFLHRGMTSVDQLADRYLGDHSMEQWPHSLRTDVVLRLADPRSESVLETRVLMLCYRYGLPKPELQYEILDNGVVIARVDFAWPDLGLFMEADGKMKYQSLVPEGMTPGDVVFNEKRREDRVREVTGWFCIRVTWDDLNHPERLVARIREAMRRAAA